MKITLDLDRFIAHMRFLRDHKSVDGETVRIDQVMNYFPNVHKRTVQWGSFEEKLKQPYR